MHVFSHDEFDERSEQSQLGLIANIRGKLYGAFLGGLFGSTRVNEDRNDNLRRFGSNIARIHTLIMKKDFTFLERTQPERTLIAHSKRSNPNRFAIYGLRLADLLKAGKERGSTMRLTITNFETIRKRIKLGYVIVPREFINATNVDERDDMMDKIDARMAELHHEADPKRAWPEVVDYRTHENVWEFMDATLPSSEAAATEDDGNA